MKRLIVLLSLLAVGTLPAQTPAPAPTPASAPATAPAAKTQAKPAPAKQDDAKKKEEPKIAGQTVARSSGGYLGIELVQGTFKVSFYDAKKKPVAADVTWAVARWLVNYNKTGDERAMLSLASDGKALTCARTVPAPHTFRLYLSLFKDQDPNANPVEFYTIDFSG